MAKRQPLAGKLPSLLTKDATPYFARSSPHHVPSKLHFFFIATILIYCQALVVVDRRRRLTKIDQGRISNSFHPMFSNPTFMYRRYLQYQDKRSCTYSFCNLHWLGASGRANKWFFHSCGLSYNHDTDTSISKAL